MNIKNILSMCFLVIVFCPWAVGLVDIFMWCVTGNKLSGIPWGELRGMVFGLWPIAWAVAIGFFIG